MHLALCGLLFYIGFMCTVAPEFVVPDANKAYNVFDLIRMWGLFACLVGIMSYFVPDSHLTENSAASCNGEKSNLYITVSFLIVILISILEHVRLIQTRMPTSHHTQAIIANVFFAILLFL